jgi:hypothetical protein
MKNAYTSEAIIDFIDKLIEQYHAGKSVNGQSPIDYAERYFLDNLGTMKFALEIQRDKIK